MTLAYQTAFWIGVGLLCMSLWWPKNEHEIDRSIVQLICMGGGLSMLLWALLFFVLSRFGGAL